MPTMTVAVAREQRQADNIDEQPERADHDEKVWVVDLLAVRQPIERFNEDGEAQRDEEDGVDERSKDFGPSPAKRVLRRVPSGYLKMNELLILSIFWMLKALEQ